jgi:hypothetical protein
MVTSGQQRQLRRFASPDGARDWFRFADDSPGTVRYGTFGPLASTSRLFHRKLTESQR